jgi:hypothetical protein
MAKIQDMEGKNEEKREKEKENKTCTGTILSMFMSVSNFDLFLWLG